MKRFWILTLVCSASVSAYYNERLYEGINPTWRHNEIVEGRLNVVEAFLPPDPVVLEAGAKDGDDTIKFAKLWPQGKIISFEPNPNQFKKYVENAKKHPNMFGHNLALHTYNGTATFYLCWGSNADDPVFEGASSLLPPSPAQEIHYRGPEIIVPCVILDDWCKNNNVSYIDFMWLDMEGFELQCLRSSPNILKTVKVIHTEINIFPLRKSITLYPELRQFLESEGFIEIAKWYNEGVQGDAVFVRREVLREKGYPY